MNPKTPFADVTDRETLFPGVNLSSQYLAMRDGTRLALDLYLPTGRPSNLRLPTLLVQSRYWRAMELRPPLNLLASDADELDPRRRGLRAFYVRRGYAMVYVDVRGTGASFGTLRFPWEPVCIQDAIEVLDWICAQPWSNGKVGGMGVSYLGTTAELLLATRHPSVRAVAPMFNHPDAYADISLPGGLINRRFLRDWSEMDAYLDRNQLAPLLGVLPRLMVRGCRPVQGDRGALAEAVKGHRYNGSAYRLASLVTFRDDVDPRSDASPDLLGLHTYRQAILESQVPSYGWASWLDAGTADAALRRFLTYPGADQVVIGAWNHGATLQASPYRPANDPLSPSLAAQRRALLHFFDQHLKDGPLEAAGERQVTFYVLGSEHWESSPSWPPPGVRSERWYLAEGGCLEQAVPGSPDGQDVFQVDFQASSGLLNRWWELSPMRNQTVTYPGRAQAAGQMLCYLTPPLEAPLELRGSPLLHLELACSAQDCAIFAYLEDVAPDGQVYYLTEGLLRALHRRVGHRPPYTPLGPYHSCKREDAWPLEPGAPAEILLACLPVAARIEAGHRLRLGLAGHDRETFPRLPESGELSWTVFRNSQHASWIELPIL